jgi:hypothetical protein
MTKNKKRARAKSKPAPKPAIVEDEVIEDALVTLDGRASKTSKVSRSQAAAERIEDEYAYISGDLRRVFILAAAMFALLIALNVILNLTG